MTKKVVLKIKYLPDSQISLPASYIAWNFHTWYSWYWCQIFVSIYECFSEYPTSAEIKVWQAMSPFQMHESISNAMELSICTDMFAKFNSGTPIENLVIDFFTELAKINKLRKLYFLLKQVIFIKIQHFPPKIVIFRAFSA